MAAAVIKASDMMAGVDCKCPFARSEPTRHHPGILQIFCPTGKSLLIFRNRVKPLLQKYFCFPLTQISSLIPRSRSDKRGVAHVINVERDAVDAGSTLDELCCRVR